MFTAELIRAIVEWFRDGFAAWSAEGQARRAGDFQEARRLRAKKWAVLIIGVLLLAVLAGVLYLGYYVDVHWVTRS